MGIYCDILTDNYKIYNNTTAFCERGILTAAVADVDIQYNTIYETTQDAFTLAGGIYNGNTNNNVKYNIIVQKSKKPLMLLVTNEATDKTPAMADFDYNIYARPIDDYAVRQSWELPFYSKAMGSLPVGQNFRSFEEWQSFSGKDIHSKKSPVSITNESDLQFEYNSTSSVKTVQLSRPMIDMKGTKYATSVTLQPYSSAVLMKDANPAPADATLPIVSTFSMPSTSSSLLVPISLFTASDNIGVTGYLLTETSTKPLSGSTGWSSTAPTSYVFTTIGAKSLYAWAKDAAGNVSAPF